MKAKAACKYGCQ